MSTPNVYMYNVHIIRNCMLPLYLQATIVAFFIVCGDKSSPDRTVDTLLSSVENYFVLDSRKVKTGRRLLEAVSICAPKRDSKLIFYSNKNQMKRGIVSSPIQFSFTSSKEVEYRIYRLH